MVKTHPEIPIQRTIPVKCYLVNFSNNLFSSSLGGKKTSVSSGKRPVTKSSYRLKKKILLEGGKISKSLSSLAAIAIHYLTD